MVHADLPLSPANGKQEQRRHRSEPERQIQHQHRQMPGKYLPKDPQQVVQRPQSGPQRQRLQQSGPLSRHVHPHIQRSSRASRELPRSRRDSS